MNNEIEAIKQIEKKIEEYCNCEGILNKGSIRNDIFLLIYPFLEKWVKSILGKKKIYVDNSEMLSLSWDCFVFCLEKYRPEKKISILGHSYSYTNFFLLSWISKKYNLLKNESGNSELDNQNDKFDIYYENIDELRRFKDILPEDYKQIFDDALLSMAGRPDAKVGYVKSEAYSQYKYQEAKKAFKFVIDFLLRR